MSDPLRSDPVPVPDASGEADRLLRIEQLLLSGLDHYFAGEYEQAINIWTRVVFLERGHDRAHAYIERARSALAERHRESEELVHRGVDAYNAGAIAESRELLTRAIEHGGPNDMALVFLERLSRLAPAISRDGVAARPVNRAALAPHPPLRPSRSRRWVFTAVAACLLAAAVVFGGAPIASWMTDAPDAAPARTLQPRIEPLPIVRVSEVVLDRARSLYADGHLKDALRALSRIDLADPLRPEADRLRADVQRQLLASTGAGGTPPAPPPAGQETRP